MHTRVPLAFLAPRALLAHGELVVHQNTQVLLCRVAFQQVCTQPVMGHGVTLPKVQDPAFAFTEFQKVPLYSLPLSTLAGILMFIFLI